VGEKPRSIFLRPSTDLIARDIGFRLGAGGMGEVWLARDLRLDRKVAVKVLPSPLTEDAGRVARFQHEARAASALNHPNVCTIHALGVADDGRLFIAMEYVDGATLRQLLVNHRRSISRALDITIQSRLPCRRPTGQA
jgi:serine/threonine protein kinase